MELNIKDELAVWPHRARLSDSTHGQGCPTAGVSKTEQVIVSITLLKWGRKGISESKANLRQRTHRVWEARLGLSDSGQLLYILGAKFMVAGSPPCV